MKIRYSDHLISLILSATFVFAIGFLRAEANTTTHTGSASKNVNFNFNTSDPQLQKQLAELLSQKIGTLNINFEKGSIPAGSQQQPVIININFGDMGSTTIPLATSPEPTIPRDSASVTTAPAPEDSSKFKLIHHDLRVGLVSHSIKINGSNKTNSSTSELLSDSATSINIDWRQKWHERWSSSFGLKYRTIDVSDQNGSSIIADGEKSTFELNIAGIYHFRPKWDFVGILSQGKKYFINSDGSTLELAPTDVTSLEIKSIYKFLDHSTGKYSAHAGLKYINSSGDIEAGTGYSIGASYERALVGQHFVGASANINFENQNSSLFEQATTDFGFFINYRRFFGGGKK